MYLLLTSKNGVLTGVHWVLCCWDDTQYSSNPLKFAYEEKEKTHFEMDIHLANLGSGDTPVSHYSISRITGTFLLLLRNTERPFYPSD